MSRWLWMMGLLVVGGVATVIADPPAGPGGGQQGAPQGGPGGQRRADNDDHGRPVEKIAKELGVTPEKFREVFKKVKPAPRGEVPTEEQRAANRKILAEGLGVTPEKIDAVMDKYRPEGPNAGDRGPQGRGREERRGPPGGAAPGNGPPGNGAPGSGRSNGPPPHNSERFVEHAMQFDTDKDGKLDRDELMKFAEDMGRRRNEIAGGGADRDRPDGPDSPAKDSERPPRPPRPE